MKKQLLIGLCAFVLCLSVGAQTQIHVPFACGFEAGENLSDWHLNEGTPAAPDRWVIGNGVRNDGRQSLYISSDGGQNACYSGEANIVCAYRTIRFPQTGKREEYEITFDWKCEGNAQKSAMYVYIGAASTLASIPVSSTSGTLDPNFIKGCKVVSTQTDQALSGQNTWVNASLKVPFAISASAAQYDFILAFIWVSGKTAAEEVTGRLSACVDNVQIASNRAKKPASVTVAPSCEDSALVVTWESVLTQFMLEYKNVNASYWRSISGISSKGTVHTFTVPQLREGAYSVRVRGILPHDDTPADTSAYQVANNVVLYCPENHCINFLDLDNPDTECTYGTYSNPFAHQGKVDFGPDEIESRHTVNWEQGITDPRTDNKLLTIPPGAMASVRLGNWKTGGEGEAISYTFVADTVDQAILLLNYAVVLEDPNHNKEEQPFFSLEILDQKGNLISPDCGAASFYAGYGDGEWHDILNERRERIRTWKDWTSIGLHIHSRYHGQTLQVRLQTRDCTLGGHYGYAYFTIDCVSARLHTDNCGNDSHIEVEAPEGFVYHWTDDIGRDWGSERDIVVDADKHTYYCEACYREQSGCCFTLSTDMAPRFPVADFTWRWTPEKCKNNITLVNRSHIMTRYNGVENHTSEACESYEWYFSNGVTTSVPSPVITCRPEGDTVVATLRAMLSEGACDTVTTATIIVPSILTPDQTVREDRCEGEAVFFDGDWRSEQAIYTQTFKNRFGCDSVIHLNLVIHPVSPDTWLTDTACSTDTYVFGGLQRTESNPDYQYWAKNMWGCDSVVHLNLTVVEHLELNVENLPVLCADDERLQIDYQVFKGKFDSLEVRFSADALAAGFRNRVIYDNDVLSVTYEYGADILPGLYSVELEFFQSGCTNQLFTLPFEIRYPASVIEQKWNDVLYVLNSRYNGGYTFTSYQWFRNGQPIDGEVNSYLYLPKTELGTEDLYTVLLTRQDGKQVLSCPFVPTVHTDLYEFPTLLRTGQQVPVRMPRKAVLKFYTLTGGCYSVQAVGEGEQNVSVPRQEGYYLLHTMFDDTDTVVRKVLVTD
ncbi:MAG: fibronectin type III domain-containing protein [Paludibacteraceae bacterium]|nr:fibronectin type III domain-containing protein [Paludibacteraceae bacterium]